ncbi:hypothetical protein LPK64_29135, partial [Klebsiella pneumoniae]|nr:hypothetical protein [Klebsiella pneumoniae]
ALIAEGYMEATTEPAVTAGSPTPPPAPVAAPAPAVSPAGPTPATPAPGAVQDLLSKVDSLLES